MEAQHPGRRARAAALRVRIGQAIRDYAASHEGRPPTFAETMAACDITSKGRLSYHLGVMEREGTLRRLGGARGLQVIAPAPVGAVP